MIFSLNVAEINQCASNVQAFILHHAIINGHGNLFTVCLNSNTDLNLKPNGKSPVYQACISHQKEMIEELYKTGKIDLSDEQNRPNTLFFLCANNGNVAVMKQLARQYDINPNEIPPNMGQMHKGFTPLQIAAQEGHLDVVNFLLNESEIDVQAINEVGQTALHSAASKGYTAIVAAMLRYWPSAEYKALMAQVEIDSPENLAKQEGHFGVVKLIKEHKPSLTGLVSKFFGLNPSSDSSGASEFVSQAETQDCNELTLWSKKHLVHSCVDRTDAPFLQALIAVNAPTDFVKEKGVSISAGFTHGLCSV